MDTINWKEVLPEWVDLKPDADPSKWPEMGTDIVDVTWQGAEPDVNIMGDYIDDYSLIEWVGDDKFHNKNQEFVRRVYLDIGHDIEFSGTAQPWDQIGAVMEKVVEKQLEGMEPPEPDYPEYD